MLVCHAGQYRLTLSPEHVHETRSTWRAQTSTRMSVYVTEPLAILYHTRNQAAPLQHLSSPDILIRSGDMVDDLDIIEED